MAPIPVQSSNLAFRTRRLRARWPWHVFWVFCSLVFSTMALTLLCASSEVDRQRTLREVEQQNVSLAAASLCQDPAEVMKARQSKARVEKTIRATEAGPVATMRDILLRAVAPRDFENTKRRASLAWEGPRPCPTLAMTDDPAADCSWDDADDDAVCSAWARCAASTQCPLQDIALVAASAHPRAAIMTIDQLLHRATRLSHNDDFWRNARRHQDEQWAALLQPLEVLLAAHPQRARLHLEDQLPHVDPPRLRGLLRMTLLEHFFGDRRPDDRACRSAYALSLDEQADFSKPVEILYGAIRGARAKTLVAERATVFLTRCTQPVVARACEDVASLEQAAPEVAPLMSLRMELRCDVAGALRDLRQAHDAE